MKNRILFYALVISVLFFSACGTDPKMVPDQADLDCDTCLYMISKQDGNYALRRIDVAKSDEKIYTSKDNGIYHVLRFHPKDSRTQEMWRALWDNGNNGLSKERPSPLDSDFIQINSRVTAEKLLGDKPDTREDIAIGYLDQVPLEPNPNPAPFPNDSMH